MTAGLTKSEQLALTRINPKAKLEPFTVPVGDALKLSGYEFAVIFDIFLNLYSLPTCPDFFSIINNRYLTFPNGDVYDLIECTKVSTPKEKKLMALTFWI
jgi:hypothetical protein|tara:strand:- start:337 stop:636 length:300 start_codon:yes stop_codon:yes gene_type:complete